jgi:hypothetical protein
VIVASDALILFPPLPEMPAPPVVGSDPRQSSFRGIVGALTEATSEWGQIRATNLALGYHASAPSLGVIKSAHEQALAHFDMRIVHDRWDQDLLRWLGKSLVRWVQRTKRVSTELHTNGIAVEIEAQDDLGYYRYGFDLMPRAAPVA